MQDPEGARTSARTASARRPASPSRPRRPGSSRRCTSPCDRVATRVGEHSSWSTSRSDGARPLPDQRNARRPPARRCRRRARPLVPAVTDRRLLLEGPPARLPQLPLVGPGHRTAGRRRRPPLLRSLAARRPARRRRAERVAPGRPAGGPDTAGAMGGPRDAPAARPRRRLAVLGAGRGVVPLLDQGPFRHRPGSRGYRAARRRQAYHGELDAAGPAPARRRRVALERPTPPNALEAVLDQRRTWREFGGEPLAKADGRRASCGGSGASAGGWRAARRDMRCGRRRRRAHDRSWKSTWSPSRVAGLQPGLYHYADRSAQPGLASRAVSPARTLPRFLPRQWWFHGAAALWVMSAVFPRIAGTVSAPRGTIVPCCSKPVTSVRRSASPPRPWPRTVLHAGARR